MATEAELYLRKARESLASAEADVEAGRHNSAANRSYYAAFQAAVAALIHWGVRSPDSEWAHRFVPQEFASKLIRGRKLFASSIGGHLETLFKLRIKADYESRDVAARPSKRAVDRARQMVHDVGSRMTELSAREVEAGYNVGMTTKTREPIEHVEEFKRRILAAYPDVEFKVIQRSERDFTIKIYGDYEDMDAVAEALGTAGIDLLVDEDVWIVMIGLERTLPQD